MTVLQNNTSFMDEKLFTVKEPMSALTHLIGAVCSIFAMPVLLIHASLYHASKLDLIAYMIFMISMILLYSASTVYHSFSISPKVNKALKKIDHMMIFIMIAGSYTPVALIAIGGFKGMLLFITIWSLAILGMIFKFCFVTCPKWVSSVIYTCMGWTCIFFMKDIINCIPLSGFLWLLAGGILYSIGAIVYAMKLSIFEKPIHGFRNHEIFHCFILAGSLCHFIFMYHYLVLLM